MDILFDVIEIGDYVYKSQLYSNYYAIDTIQKTEGQLYRVRYPYKSKGVANDALQNLKKTRSVLVPEPDYKVEIIKGGKLLCTR
ncbi:MAG: SPOR domain-containing protein [Alphaproteobacteria bacterium]|nr:SPOR domain-containing protein [Alphaproteobacteria bacterium]